MIRLSVIWGAAAGSPTGLAPEHFSSVGWVLLALAGLATAANQILKLVDRTKEQPPAAETYRTLKECKILHAGQDARIARLECETMTIRDEVKQMNQDLDQRAEQRAAAIHTRINVLAEDMPGKIIALLRNTGALK